MEQERCFYEIFLLGLDTMDLLVGLSLIAGSVMFGAYYTTWVIILVSSIIDVYGTDVPLPIMMV